jgi:peptidoglycan/xylan/chitin deacetylase (PgdA/CDA1 family)
MGAPALRSAFLSPAIVLAILLAACSVQPTDRPGDSSGIGSAATGVGQGGDVEPWNWPEDRVFAAVDEVRAGRDLTPAEWPGGARVAVALSFDVDNETIWLRNGDTNVGGLSQGEYGARRALGRVLDTLDEAEIPASFFIPAMSLTLAPEMADRIAESGRHEFAVHGWIHERNNQLDAATERRLLEQSIERLEEITGVRPVGYRAPSWNFSPATLDIVMDLGFRYESSLMADDRPYEILQRGEPTGMVELPVDWILDDAPLMNPLGDRYSPPREVLQVYIDEFDVAWEEGTLFVLTMHPHYIGHRSRIVVLRELIDHMVRRGDVWFATHLDIAEYVRAQAGME